MFDNFKKAITQIVIESTDEACLSETAKIVEDTCKKLNEEKIRAAYQIEKFDFRSEAIGVRYQLRCTFFDVKPIYIRGIAKIASEWLDNRNRKDVIVYVVA